MPRPPRRSCTDQSKSYAISDDEDDKKNVVDVSDIEFECDKSNSDKDSSDDEQDQIAPSSSSPNFGGAAEDEQSCARGSSATRSNRS